MITDSHIVFYLKIKGQYVKIMTIFALVLN